MIEVINNCDCMEELIIKGRVMRHIPPYTTPADGIQAEDGELCIVNDVYEDQGYYDEYEWVSSIVAYKELYPIKFCPICGKEIEYKRFNSLTKKL